MRKINAEKELDKIKKGNKNKIIIGVCTLLVIIAIGSTYALYQVRHSNKLVYNNVDSFKKRDIYLSVLVDGKTEDNFPNKNSGIVYTGIECDKEYQEAYFDNTEWEFHFSSKGPNKCTIKFETGNLPNTPELYQGMIPIVYGNNGLMYVADLNTDWYNYQDHRWANAVLVDASNTTIKNKYFKEDNTLRDDIAGIQVPMEEVLQMYVWIPRYKYQLWNVNNEGKQKQLINIKFEKDTENTGDITCTYTDMKDGTVEEKCIYKEENPVENGDWYTHPAFKFGDTELKGIWVGKFEPSDSKDLNGRAINVINEITILPDKTSMVNKTVNTMFNAERAIETNSKYNLNATEIDTHMAKNMEWGAVAYLTQSIYGIYKDEKTCNIDGMNFATCEVWINNAAQGAGDSNSNVTYKLGGTYTGCVGDSVSAGPIWNDDDGSIAKCKTENRWNKKGVNASTTGNMYGVYDMVGGAWEQVMSAIVNQIGGRLYIARSGFQAETLPETKYYDMYTFSDSYTTHERGHLGDSTRETLLTLGNPTGGWNADYSYFPRVASGSELPWFIRGGGYDIRTRAGIFAFSWTSGGTYSIGSFRSIITAQDGMD